MAKILFINPASNKYSDTKYWSTSVMNELMDHYVTTLPKLVGMIFAALTPPEHTFINVDEEVEDIDFDMDPDIVAITSMTVQAPRAYEISKRFREKGVLVVIGGIHASVLPEEVAAHCDVLMTGEGDHLWTAFLKDYADGQVKARYHAADYPPVEKFVSPRMDVIRHERYLMYPLQATRGCPYDCEFCSIRFSSGNRYRMKPVEQVVAEIQAYESYNKGMVHGTFRKSYQFVDDNLYVNRDYVIKLFKAMRPLNITWTGQGTMNTAFDEEVLNLMAESGCKGYNIGFESLSEETLREANKPGLNVIADYQRAIDNLIRYGIIPAGFFIFGFDTDDVSVFQKTTDFSIENHLIQPYFSLLTPYPGTRLYDRINVGDRIFDQDWSHYNNLHCVFAPKKMNKDELEEGLGWATHRLSTMKVIRDQLEYFWEHMPQDKTPRLSFKERQTLRLIGLKLRKYSREYQDFLSWAAGHKKSRDIGTIVAALVFNNIADQFSDRKNPADMRAQAVNDNREI